MKKQWKLIALLLAFFLATAVVPMQANAATQQVIIVNKSENRLYLYENGTQVAHFPVATGKRSGLTPEGVFQVNVKWKCPIYYATNKKGCASDNPLGPRWLGLNVPGTSGYTYGIHGTSQPNSIGTYASSGCVRMHNKDITWLFDRVQTGAKVVITSSKKSADAIASSHGVTVKDSPTKAPTNTPAKGTTYTIKKNDTLYNIAKQHGVTVDNLKKWNNLKSTTIKVGQTLVVSVTKQPTTTTPAPTPVIPTTPTTPTKTIQKQVNVKSTLNVRSKTSLSSSVLGSLKKGQIVEVTAIKQKWATIQYKGKTGYVHTDYLKDVPASNKK